MHKNWFRFLSTVHLLKLMNNDKLNNTTFHIKQTKKISIIDNEVLSLHNEISGITKDHYFHTFNELFKDLEKIKYDNSKSVNSKFTSYNKDSLNALDNLEKNISLYNHTKNVIRFAIECTHNKPDVIKAIVILLSLVHDFGKAKFILDDVIKNNSNIYSNTRHDIVSSYYLKKVLLKNKEQDNLEINHISFLCNALENQHSQESIDNEILELFYKADSLAREYELSTIYGKNYDN